MARWGHYPRCAFGDGVFFAGAVSGEGSGRYGGNTLAAQMHMVPWYYRQLLDAGAAGACHGPDDFFHGLLRAFIAPAA